MSKDLLPANRLVSSQAVQESSIRGDSISRKKVFFFLVGYKCCLFLFLLLAIFLLPAFDTGRYGVSPHWPPGPPGLASHFGTWDSALYLHLAQYGYEKNSLACAFYPLLPFFLRGCLYIAPGFEMVLCVLMTNLFSVAGLYYFYRFVSKRHGAEIAFRALILILAFPGALFFNLIYTESLFLLLIVLFFLLISEERYLLAALCGFLLPLTRAIGLLCIIPATWEALEKEYSSSPGDRRQFVFWRGLMLRVFFSHRVLPLFGLTIGVVAYFTFMHCATGNMWEGFEAQKDYLNAPSVGNIFNLPGFLRAMTNIGSLHGMGDSLIDRYFFIVFLFLLPGVWRLDKTYFFYALISGLIPAMSNYFFSYTRFFILCFPLFIVMAIKLKQSQMLFYYVVAMAGIIQMVFLLRQINFYWAG